MKCAKFKVGDLVEDKYEGVIREITVVNKDPDGHSYSLDSMGWYYLPEEDLILVESKK